MSKQNHLILGTTSDGAITLSPKTLLRHFACFGSSGSGKTVASKVLMEELARNGIPVIAFDPQGDIASLAVTADRDAIKKSGTDPSIRDDYDEKVEVVVWTPGSSKGIPLCINPLQFDDVGDLNAEDKTRFFSSTAKNIASLVGYDLDNDDGKSAEAILAVIFEHCFEEKVVLKDFTTVVKILQDMPESVATVVETVGTQKFIRGLTKKLSLLTLGSRKLIFQTGVPASINTLLGKDGSSDKTRISVIYLNTLQSAEEKEFFIAGIAQLLYRWMLKNPLGSGQEGIQCAMFIDEIAPYIPPVKVPACKESLELLFRQGRKYGVSCLIATQSPGDIDYKAIGQFSTFILGTLNTKQDIDKVKKRLESVAPKEIDFITTKLPALKPGNFLAVSPDEYDKVQEMKVRWLVTDHRVISEKQLDEINPPHLVEFYEKTEEEPVITQSEPEPDPTENDVVDEPTVIEKASVKTHDKLLVVNNMILERDLKKRMKPFLEGTFFKSEELVSSKFEYLPLIKIDLIFMEEKGLFRKKTTEIPENLYLNYKTEDVLYVEDKSFKFANVVDRDPHKIEDLDNHCTFVEKDKDDVDFDFRSLGGKKLKKSKITKLMERKYRVEVNHVEMVLFPTWTCEIKIKKEKKSRMLKIDGVYGNPL
jgi:hypothetical protein